MVVDPDMLNIESVRQSILSFDSKLKIDFACSAKEAVEKISERNLQITQRKASLNQKAPAKYGYMGVYPYRLILVEVEMTQTDGFETASIIRELYKSMKVNPQPYIVATTSFALGDESSGMLKQENF